MDFLAVAYADEGVSLRQSGIRLPIVVMNTEESALASLLEFQLQPVIFSMRGLRALQHLLKGEAVQQFPIHIELETGMNRLGFSADQLPQLLRELSSTMFKVQSVFSHLAASEEAQQDEFTLGQLERYQQMAKRMQEALGLSIPQKHISNPQQVLSACRNCNWI